MKAILAAPVMGVTLHPLIVNELRTNTADFPNVNSEFVLSLSPYLQFGNKDMALNHYSDLFQTL